jgi:serine protease Do
MTAMTDFRALSSRSTSNLVRLSALVLGLLALETVAAAEPGFPDVVEQVTRSVVGVGTYDRLRSPPAQLLGTGFVVGDGRTVITNAHVVNKPLATNRQETYVIFIGQGEQGRSEPVEVREIDDEHDLAVLQFKVGAALPAFRFADARKARPGQAIAFTGYPIGAILGLYPVTHTGTLAGISPIAIPRGTARELTTEQIRLRRGAWNIFQLDATAYPGNSGSPLYEVETGDLLGVINMVLVKRNRESALSDPSGISYAIPANHITDLLDRLRISY